MLQTRRVGRMIAYTGIKRTDPTHHPVASMIMTHSQLRLIANVRRAWRLIDWQTVGAIVRDGLIMTVALAIVCASYIAKDTVKVYSWLQPRIANLLQHPAQTLQNGPNKLYAECVEATLFGDNPTIGQKIIVTVVAEYQHFTDNVWDFVEEIKYNFSEFTFQVQRMI